VYEVLMNLSETHTVAVAVAGLVGLPLGSFAGVVADRVPRGESVVQPASRCTNCGRMLGVLDNVPVISYVLLRGRCRACRTKIPARDLTIEITTALALALVAWRLPTVWAVPSYGVLLVGLAALSAIDFEHQRLPTAVLYWTVAVAGPLLVLASALSNRWDSLIPAAIGAAACFLVFLGIWFVAPRGMGFGDVRLAGLCGGWLGWLGASVIPVGILAGFLLAGVPAIVMLATGKANRKTKLAFGPYLVLGTVVGICFGRTIAHAWASI
jgi:leader peptidase (prepilin peptidase)/N-methyltransferase